MKFTYPRLIKQIGDFIYHELFHLPVTFYKYLGILSYESLGQISDFGI